MGTSRSSVHGEILHVDQETPRVGCWGRFKSGILGDDVELLVKGLVRGFVVDTPLKAFIVRLVVIGIDLAAISDSIEPLASPGERTYRYVNDAIYFAALASVCLETLALALPQTRQVAFGALPWADAVVCVLTLMLGCEAVAALSPTYSELYAAPTPAAYVAVIAPCITFSLLWAMLYGTSLHPKALRVGTATAGACTIILFARAVSIEAKAGWSAHAVLRSLLPIILFPTFCLLFYASMSPRPAAQNAPGRKDEQESKLGLYDLPGGPRCACRRCAAAESTSRGEDATLHGGGGGPGGDAGPAGRCWKGRVLAALDDEALLFRSLLIALWVIIPLGMALACSLLSSLVRVDEVVEWDMRQLFYSFTLPGWAVASAYMLLGLTVHLGRVMARQRDDALRDLVPKDIANMLVRDLAHRHVANRARPKQIVGKSVHPALDGTSGVQSSPAGSRSMAAHSTGSSILPLVPLTAAEGPEFALSSFMSGSVGQRVHKPRYRRDCQDVSIMFSDLCGFTELSAQLAPDIVFTLLHTMFGILDRLTDHFNVFKYETVGDAYICLANLKLGERAEEEDIPREEHVVTTLRMGIALVQVARNMKIAFPDGRVWSAQARVGLNIGPLSAGVVGLKRQLLSVVGDTINVAARMESLSLPSHVQATAAFHSALPPRFQSLFDKRVVHAKGKGDVDAFILDVPTKESALRELGLDICGDPVALKRILGQSA